MEENQYIFQDRVVIFIDVLGFQEKLKEFEHEAIANVEKKGEEFYISSKVNQFITTFKNVVSSLDKDNLRYYLFSDNICITIDYSENKDLLITVLFKLCDLFYAFAQKGYFLRGGIDVGKFIDEELIAVGIPLANAYLIESKQAVFPRIVISQKFSELLKTCQENGSLSPNKVLDKEYLINSSCEIEYLNVFYSVINKDDKVSYLSSFRDIIVSNVTLNNHKEHIFLKYQWLVKEFNNFIDKYTHSLIYLDENVEPTETEIQQIKDLKIIEYGL